MQWRPCGRAGLVGERSELHRLILTLTSCPVQHRRHTSVRRSCRAAGLAPSSTTTLNRPTGSLRLAISSPRATRRTSPVRCAAAPPALEICGGALLPGGPCTLQPGRPCAPQTKAFDKSVKLLSSLQGDIDSKTWWKVRDQLRGTGVYDLRSSMLAINGVLPAEKKADAAKAYKKVFTEMEALDLACKKKEQALATKENSDLLEAIAAYKGVIS